MFWRTLAAAAGLVLSVWGAEDTPRRHVEAVSSARHEFTIRMGGTVDGENTRDPISYDAWRQAFEPMRRVRMENTGDTEVVNPWVIVNGKRNWRTVRDIAEDAMRAYGDPAKMTDAEKARAIFEFQRTHRFHATTGDMEVRDPVKMYNVYGFSLCGDNAPVLADVWRAAGLTVRRGYPIGHCVSEAWYDGGWHMLDADESVIFLDRDNRTIMPEKRVAGDHDLARRGYPNDMLGSLYTYDGAHGGQFPSHAWHEMTLKLRPGEALEWAWGHVGKSHYAPQPTLYTLAKPVLSRWGKEAWAQLANGKWSYAPDLRKPSGQKYAAVSNVRWTARGAAPAKAGEPATLTWKMEAPYAIVGGAVRAQAAKGAVAIRFSRDGANWADVEGGNLEAHFPNQGDAIYSYFLRVELREGTLESIAIENDLQMAPLSLPALTLGENKVVYTDQTQGPRSVRVSFDWVERSSIAPPAAPAAPSFPADAASVEGTRLAFEWAAPQGANISDYQFQMGDEPNLRWALSPAFDVMTDKPRFALNREGMLTPGRTCYWHVRARSAEGVWSAWSKTWSFTPQGPAAPVRVRLEETGPGAYTLRWDTDGAGRKPVLYKIYASDEKGFPASDEPYRGPVGNQKDRGLFPGQRSRMFPANRLGESREPRFRLKPRNAFYRVVAIDEKGNRSGSSEYAQAPRPFVYSEPVTRGKVGEPYRYEAKTILAIGDLTNRDFGPGQSYQSAYWDVDQPRFSLDPELPRCGNFNPEWLHIDPKTGVLTGTPGPGDAKEYQVNVKVEIPGAGSYVQSFPLRIEGQSPQSPVADGLR